MARALNGAAEPLLRGRASHLLRELLYVKLDEGLGDAADLLARLSHLAVTRRQRARYLIRRLQWELKREDFGAAIESARELASLGQKTLLPARRDVRYLVAVSPWLADVMGRVRRRLDPDRLRREDARLQSEVAQALARDDADALRRIVQLYAQWPQADQARLALARRLSEQGRLQQAEFYLLKARGSSDPRIAGIATEQLVRLYDSAGFYREAAELMEELAGRFRNVPLSHGRTGEVVVAQFPRDRLTWLAYRQTRLPDWRVRRVVIREHRWLQAEKALIEAYGRYRRRYRTPDNFAFHLLEHDDLLSERTVSVVDKQTGLIVGKKRIPQRNSYQFWAKTPIVGHFLAMGRPGGLHGISLFELSDPEPYWNRTFTPLRHSSNVLRPGPAGPGFCIFQTSRYLIAVDPADGSLLWQRSDIPPNSGLFADQLAGLFGDDRVIVLFQRVNPRSGRTPYTIFKTATGEVVGRGDLDVDTGVQRRVFGRKLFYVSNAPSGRWMRIWDPLTGRFEWEAPYSGRLMATVTPDDELVVVTPDGQLIIRDVQAGVDRLRLQLNAEDLLGLGFVRAFGDRKRYYVNLGLRPTPGLIGRKVHLYSSDDFLAMANFEGEIWAVDRADGHV
ncbi:MAG TPA: hypothetical protein EYP14_01655, partial [Planctomycetaceae bacterium]|nr:hypothetical protein [Planctomycetaceae bacterium]